MTRTSPQHYRRPEKRPPATAPATAGITMSAQRSAEVHHRLPAHSTANLAWWPGSQEREALEALRLTCYGAGHTSADLGRMLVERGLCRSESSADARVRACLNAGKSECFSPSELLAIMAFTGRYDFLRFQCRALGLSEPTLADPKELLRRSREELERYRALAADAEARVSELEAQVGQNESSGPISWAAAH